MGPGAAHTTTFVVHTGGKSVTASVEGRHAPPVTDVVTCR
jgi:hypothetical protein